MYALKFLFMTASFTKPLMCSWNSSTCSMSVCIFSSLVLTAAGASEKIHGLPNTARPSMTPSHPVSAAFWRASARSFTSPLPTMNDREPSESRISTARVICCHRAGTSDISLRVRAWIATAAGSSASNSGSHVSSSSLLYPIRVLTETGIRRPADSAPFFAARISSRASAGFWMSAAPHPCLSTSRAGQPMLMSNPSKPSSAQSRAPCSIYSGCAEKSCATMGRSFSKYSSFLSSFLFPSSFARTSPSAEVNSVYVTRGMSGDAYFAISWRNATSVTSSIGASTKKGRCNFSQKFFTQARYHNSSLFHSHFFGTLQFVVHAIAEPQVYVLEICQLFAQRIRRHDEVEIANEDVGIAPVRNLYIVSNLERHYIVLLVYDLRPQWHILVFLQLF